MVGYAKSTILNRCREVRPNPTFRISNVWAAWSVRRIRSWIRRHRWRRVRWSRRSSKHVWEPWTAGAILAPDV